MWFRTQSQVPTYAVDVHTKRCVGRAARQPCFQVLSTKSVSALYPGAREAIRVTKLATKTDLKMCSVERFHSGSRKDKRHLADCRIWSFAGGGQTD